MSERPATRRPDRADRFEDGVVLVAGPVRARRLAEEEGRRLQEILRWGKHELIRVRRAPWPPY